MQEQRREMEREAREEARHAQEQRHQHGTHEAPAQGRVVEEHTEYEDRKKGVTYESRPKAVVYEERPKEEVWEKVPARTVQKIEVERTVPATGGTVEEHSKPVTPGMHTGQAHEYVKEAGDKEWKETRTSEMREGGHDKPGVVDKIKQAFTGK